MHSATSTILADSITYATGAYHAGHTGHAAIRQHAKKRVENKHCLLIKHSDGWSDDRCERWLHQHGYSCETYISENHNPLPDVSRFTHVVVYGGVPCVKDAAHMKSLREEMKFLEGVLSSDMPCLGICLGAQLIAHVLGAKVKPLPCGSTEFGYSLISPTDAGSDFMQQPCKMLQWHCEGFDLPSDCTLLATGSVFPNQAFSYGTQTYGVQFHPEVTAEVLQVWHQRYVQSKHCGSDRYAKQCEQQLFDFHQQAGETDAWFDGFMRKWTGSDARYIGGCA